MLPIAHEELPRLEVMKQYTSPTWSRSQSLIPEPIDF